jgi:hypothetical protein
MEARETVANPKIKLAHLIEPGARRGEHGYELRCDHHSLATRFPNWLAKPLQEKPNPEINKASRPKEYFPLDP